MKSFPSEMIGTYGIPIASISPKMERLLEKEKKQNDTVQGKTNNGALEIKNHSFRVPFLKDEIFINNETGVLKRYNDTCFIFSQRNENGEMFTWTIFPFTYNNNKITIYSNIFIPETEYNSMIDSIKQITQVEIVYAKAEQNKRKKKNQETIDYWLLNPTKAEFDSLFENGIFLKWIEFEKIE